MLDDQCARSRVFVSNDVDLLFAFLADGGHRSVGDENARSRRSPGLMASRRPSPAKVLPSRTLKLPPSNVRGLALLSHKARSGLTTPSDSLHRETLSAATSVCSIGTSAD